MRQVVRSISLKEEKGRVGATKMFTFSCLLRLVSVHMDAGFWLQGNDERLGGQYKHPLKKPMSSAAAFVTFTFIMRLFFVL